MGNRPKTARPKCYISEILAQVGKSASDQPICCSAQFRSGIIMAESARAGVGLDGAEEMDAATMQL